MKKKIKPKMLWNVIVLALIASIHLSDGASRANRYANRGNPNDKNLAKVSWAHAVNSKDYLEAMLNDGKTIFQIENN